LAPWYSLSSEIPSFLEDLKGLLKDEFVLNLKVCCCFVGDCHLSGQHEYNRTDTCREKNELGMCKILANSPENVRIQTIVVVVGGNGGV
jgi:hypothetical protein